MVLVLPFRGALFTVESMRGEYALCTRSFDPFRGAGAAVLSDPAWLLSAPSAANLPGGAAQIQGWLR